VYIHHTDTKVLDDGQRIAAAHKWKGDLEYANALVNLLTALDFKASVEI